MDKQLTIHIYDLTGRKMKSQQSSVWGGSISEEIDVSSLPGAVYLLVIESPAGALSYKFVKTDP